MPLLLRWLEGPAVAASLALVVACSGGQDGQGANWDDGGAAPLDAGVTAVDGGTSVAEASHESGSGGGHADAAPVDAPAPVDAVQPEASAPAGDAAALDPGVAPGGNFDLSVWELQEPVGSPGAPTTIPPGQLVGPNGFHDAYFYTDPTDGSMTFWDPEDGVTTANSNYPRSELREMTAGGQAADWAVAGTHTLSATLAASVIPDHVCVGQIHLGSGTPASTKPLLELFYYATGDVELAIEQTPAGGNEVKHSVGNVSPGTKWSYVIGLSGNSITVTIDGGAVQSFMMASAFDQENMYFKAGDYDQSVGTSTTVGAKVQFYALNVFHGP